MIHIPGPAGDFKPKDSRWQILWMSTETILGLLMGAYLKKDANGVPETVYAVDIEGIPEDARIDGVTYDLVQDRIGLRIWSASFRECPPGYEIQAMDVQAKTLEMPVIQLPGKNYVAVTMRGDG